MKEENMIEFYEIECEVLDVVVNDFKRSIQELKTKEETYEFNIILDDLLESIEVLIGLVKNYKINTGMTILRSSFELVVTYVAIIKNVKIRNNYLDVTQKRNIRSCANEISKVIGFDIYDEIYTMLCEFAHPTVLRSYYCDTNKTKDGITINRNIGVFIIILLISEYNRYLSIITNKTESFILDSLIITLLSAFIVFLNNANIDRELISKYNSIFNNQQQKEMLSETQDEFKNLVIENNEVLIKKLQKSLNYNYDLKVKIMEYIKSLKN